MTPEAGLKKALRLDRPDIIAEISASGLKGRGGAGFPTGVKWNFAAAAKADEKFVICNADEGEPGTFKDRVILQEHADLVFEGMTIAGKAIGAKEGILFLRGEYTYLRPHLEAVLASAAGSRSSWARTSSAADLEFDIRIFMGAGAYICGEETALIECPRGLPGRAPQPAALPGQHRLPGPPVGRQQRGDPGLGRLHPARRAPTGSSSVGTEKSTGIKIFSVSGDCATPGVYEFPMGITVAAAAQGSRRRGRQGRADRRRLRASASRPREFERTIAFEDIPTGGSVIVFGPQRDMLDVLQNFLDFFVDESCGQCTPCRLGNLKLLEGVEMLKAGTCSMAYLKELCALGQQFRRPATCR